LASFGDALYLRNQLVRMLEEAEAESDPEIRRGLLRLSSPARLPASNVSPR
jgi:hypothetical protein